LAKTHAQAVADSVDMRLAEKLHLISPGSFSSRVPSGHLLPSPMDLSDPQFGRSSTVAPVDVSRRSPSRWSSEQHTITHRQRMSAQAPYSPRRHHFDPGVGRHSSPSAGSMNNSSTPFSSYAWQPDDRSGHAPFRGSGVNKVVTTDAKSLVKENERLGAESYSVSLAGGTHWKAKLSRNHVSSLFTVVHNCVCNIPKFDVV
jgi:hypothetical protein